MYYWSQPIYTIVLWVYTWQRLKGVSYQLKLFIAIGEQLYKGEKKKKKTLLKIFNKHGDPVETHVPTVTGSTKWL